ncbi:hypothetical protein Cus16_1270 [Curtobacterium sp. ER1/6]|nr:hypothetical protein Cus16_1270 [Curtobacterium sp. ER1/6]
MLPARVLRGDHEDLRVVAGLVAHLEDADRTDLDAHTREGRVLEQQQRVHGVAVVGQGLLEEPVVGRVDERGEQHAVEVHATGLVVDLVLVAAALGDLDDDVVRGHGALLVSCAGRKRG